jgi:hypothetical protein
LDGKHWLEGGLGEATRQQHRRHRLGQCRSCADPRTPTVALEERRWVRTSSWSRLIVLKQLVESE